MHSSSIAPEERLLNLAVALMATEHGLTKEQILDAVTGYVELVEAGSSKDALERMFERDKEALRRLGVPIETIGDHADPDDMREARYRVPTAEYALPEDVTFTPEELAILAVAGEVWSEGSLSEDARAGLRKIRALGAEVDEPVLGFAPRLSARTAAFPRLQQAIEDARVVTFAYLKPGEAGARTRRLQPLALIEYEARWHVYGFDLDQDADRTFLLTRIVGDVTVTRTGFDPALREGAGARARQGLDDVAARSTAVLEVNPGTEAWLRLGRRAQPASPAIQGLRVPFVDVHIFAEELASYGPEVRVVEPAALRDEVVRRLSAAAAAHTTQGSAA